MEGSGIMVGVVLKKWRKPSVLKNCKYVKAKSTLDGEEKTYAYKPKLELGLLEKGADGKPYFEILGFYDKYENEIKVDLDGLLKTNYDELEVKPRDKKETKQKEPKKLSLSVAVKKVQGFMDEGDLENAKKFINMCEFDKVKNSREAGLVAELLKLSSLIGAGVLKKKPVNEGEFLFSQIGELTDFLSMAKTFIKENPLYYDRNKIWWGWDKKEFRWFIVDEIDIINALNKQVKSPRVSWLNNILMAMKLTARENKPEEPKKSWVQFRNKIYDIETDESFEASPKYFITNPIKYSLGESEDTPTIDKLFESWVGEDKKEELYEIISFSLVPTYFIHRMFCLIGSGSNGKSTYLQILESMIGLDNIASSSLNLLMKERFEGSKLLNKLVCLIGETNFNLISNTDFLKKLTGEDLVRCEFKGKDSFDFRNYAKLIMATNSLPPTADKTDGFYRRWKIIKFDKKFLKEKDVLSKIPEEEYNNLALKCFNICKKLWIERVFSNDGDFEDRRKRYEDESNPLNKFIKENYTKDVNSEVLFSEFSENLLMYLEERGARALTIPAISKQLKSEGFEVQKLTIKSVTARFILGIKDIKNDTNVPKDTTSHLSSYIEPSRTLGHSGHLSHSTEGIEEKEEIEVVKIGEKNTKKHEKIKKENE